MAIFYVNNDADLAAVAPADGDTVLLRSGGVFSRAAMPASLLTPANITIGAFGTGDRPILSGGVIRSDWTYDAPNDVWSRPAYLVGARVGAITEDGVPMRRIAWDTNIATTAANMVNGQSLPAWSGSMAYDTTNRVLYIRPSAGVASDHVYTVAELGNSSGDLLSVSTDGASLLMQDIELQYAPRHAFVAYRRRGIVVDGCDFRFIGGASTGSFLAGNAVELSFGTHGAEVRNCRAYDIFDTGFTTQLYENTRQFVGDHLYLNNRVERYGMHGVEVSCPNAALPNQFVSDIEVNGLVAVDAGTFSWAGDRNGAAFTCLSNNINGSRITRAFARNVTSIRGKRLYLGLAHGGVCGIEDSTGTGTWGQAPGSGSSGATGQIDLWRNVTDNLGAPSGGRWQQVTSPLSQSFTAFLL